MGYELPAGLGVRLAQPEGEVYVLIGDGTYLINPTEIVNAVQEGLKITVVISENHGYQSIQRLQMWRPGTMFGNEFRARARNGRLEGDYMPARPRRAAEGLAHGRGTSTRPERCGGAARGRARRVARVRDRLRDRAAPLPAGLRRLVGRRAAGGLERAGGAARAGGSTSAERAELQRFYY